MGAARDEDAERMERLISAIDRLAAKLDAASSRAVTTRRVKAVRAAAAATSRPCSDLAALKARRAIARLKG